MLRLFQYRSTDRHNMLFLHGIIFLMILCALLIVISASDKQNKNLQESFLIEIVPTSSENVKKEIESWLTGFPHVVENSIELRQAKMAFTENKRGLDKEVIDAFLSSNYLNDVVLFTTQALESEKTRGEFLLSLSDNSQVLNARKMGEIEEGVNRIGNSSKLLVFSVFLILILLLFALSLLRSEIAAKKSEIRMLAFSGVSDRHILSHLRSSMGLAIVKIWFFSALVIILAFYLGAGEWADDFADITIQDIIVALAIPLIILLISMNLYTKSRAQKILKHI